MKKKVLKEIIRSNNLKKMMIKLAINLMQVKNQSKTNHKIKVLPT
jgi:hypothetical protein